MKKYIILTSGIRNMGGAQMYVANKASYYESLGWECAVFFYTEGPVYINYLKRFADNFIPELANSIWSLSKKSRDSIIKRICNEINNCDEVVIESNLLSLAYWGELIAQKIGGKHVVFILQETIPSLTSVQAEFLDFKLNRKELLNSHNRALHNIFKSHYKSLYDNYNYQLVPYCSNVLDNTPTEKPPTIIDADYNIFSIGRLDKDYIKPMLDEIKTFVEKYQTHHFNLVFIGNDNSHVMEEYIQDHFSSTKNVHLSLLGYVFPVPYDWIKLADISIASSNSVLITSEVGIPTIAIDGRDLKAIGIHNHTTTSTVFRKESEPEVSVSSLIEAVLIKRQYAKNLKPALLDEKLNFHFSKHAELVTSSSRQQLYFDVINIYNFIYRVGFVIKRILRKLLS
ncbi:MAG: glycosyltransferase [Alistipes sp.]|nr:glycosyltransferase [Alistipes sp.]